MPDLVERNCGNCTNFDTRTLSGKPASTRFPGMGVCRGERGLALGLRGPDSRCANGYAGFQPKQAEKVVFISPRPQVHDPLRAFVNSVS